jgi:hypothetical protein
VFHPIFEPSGRVGSCIFLTSKHGKGCLIGLLNLPHKQVFLEAKPLGMTLGDLFQTNLSE